MTNKTKISQTAHSAAQIPFTGLDWVWFYPAGTLCNLECAHCLVSASPESEVLLPLDTIEIETALQEVVLHQQGRPFQIGMTGGEVFLLKAQKYNQRLFPMIETCLAYSDILILTNGLLADDITLQRLKAIEARSKHSIRYRISLDGASAETNDQIRQYRGGRPTFELIMQSLQRFQANGVYPTLAYTYESSGKAADVLIRAEALKQEYKTLLQKFGLIDLELVAIPFFDQGAETVRRDRTGIPHIESPGITNHCIATYTNRAYDLFQCSYGRSFAKEVTGKTGWYKCPVLPAKQIAEAALIGRSFSESACTITIEHPQCITCFTAATQGTGMSCSG